MNKCYLKKAYQSIGMGAHLRRKHVVKKPDTSYRNRKQRVLPVLAPVEVSEHTSYPDNPFARPPTKPRRRMPLLQAALALLGIGRR